VMQEHGIHLPGGSFRVRSITVPSNGK
jgi:hypothetical protein